MRVADVEGVTGAGVVHVVALVAIDQTVVGLIVNATERDRRAHVVAFGGVVVYHIQDHLDAGLMEGTHHGLELRHSTAREVGG